MGIDAGHFRHLIVRDACESIHLWSPAAEELLMLTAAQETHLGEWLKQGWKTVGDARGVAEGPFGMEPNTFAWLRSRYPTWLGGRQVEEQRWDLRLAAIACRLRYYVVTFPLPQADDLAGLAKYWNEWYNGNPNAGTDEEAIAAYNRFVKGR